MRVLAGARGGLPAGVPSAYELTKASDGHQIVVEPEAAHRRWVRLARRATVGGDHRRVAEIVGAIIRSSGDLAARAAALSCRSAMVDAGASERAAGRSDAGIGGFA